MNPQTGIHLILPYIIFIFFATTCERCMAQLGACGITVWGVVQVVNTGTTGLKVRPCAGLSTACTPPPGNGEPNGGIGTVMEGPTSLDGYIWWKIQWEDGKVGWSTEQIGGVCVLQPCTATLSSPNGGVSLSFPQEFRWSNTGPCSNFNLAFATSDNPSRISLFSSSTGSYSVSGTDWSNVKGSLGNASTYYWSVGQIIGVPGGTVYVPRTAWRSFSVVMLAPNLTPSAPSGWSDKIVVAKSAGATSDGSGFTTEDALYASWGVANVGNAGTGAGFYNTLYVDDVAVETPFFGSPLGAGITASRQDVSLGKLTSGTHTITIKADSGLSITESDETDNAYSKTVSVSAGRFSLAVIKSPPDAGTVSVSPVPGPDGKYSKDQIVTLSANPASGFAFQGWEGGLSGNILEMPLALTQDKSVTAVFVPLPPKPTVTISFLTQTGARVTIIPSTLWRYLVEVADDVKGSWQARTVYAAESVPNPRELLLYGNLNQMFCRITPYTVREYPGFLKFPLERSPVKPSESAYNSKVTGILDHSWDILNVIKTYRNEHGTIPQEDDKKETIGMKKDRAGTEFSLDFCYDDGTGKKSVLWYDSAPKYNIHSGHKGYDYPADPGTDWVVAAYDGELDKEECKAANVAPFHGLVLKHAFGVRTYYLHMPYSSWAISSNLDDPAVVTVKKGDRLGRPGHQGVTYDHLHFGVYIGKELVDPYGEFATDGTQIQPILWEVHP